MKSPKKTYVILVPHIAIFEFAVDAASPDEACRILRRELRSGELKQARGGDESIAGMWTNPANENTRWAVMCASRRPGAGNPPLLTWNGTKVVKWRGFSPAADE